MDVLRAGMCTAAVVLASCAAYCLSKAVMPVAAASRAVISGTQQQKGVLAGKTEQSCSVLR